MEIINPTNGNFTLNSEMILAANMDFKEVFSFDIQKYTDDMRNGYDMDLFQKHQN